MKKILAFILTLSLLTTFFTVSAIAQGEEMSIENGQNISSNDDIIKYYTFCSDGNISATSFGGETEEVFTVKRIASNLEKDFENFDKVIYHPFEKEAEVYYKDGKYEKIENFNLDKYIKPIMQYKNTPYSGRSLITIKSEGTVVIDYFDGRQSAFYAEEGNNCNKLIKSLEKQYKGFDYISISPQEIMIFYKDGSCEQVENLNVMIPLEDRKWEYANDEKLPILPNKMEYHLFHQNERQLICIDGVEDTDKYSNSEANVYL